MKILGLINKDSGPGFHRIMMPLLMMQGIDTFITNSVKQEDFENVDCIYYNRVIADSVVSIAKEKGIKIIVDIDDYWHLDVHHISYQQYIDNHFADLQIKHIRSADLITTTHERLADLIKKYNPNVIITPNAIPKHEYFTVSRSESELPRIFWQGSTTHERDVAILKNPFKRLTKCATIIAGYTKHEAWGRMVNSFTNGLSHPGMVLPGLPCHEYYSNYSHADICVAPLIDSRFNSLKSNLKVLEAAHAGLPIVCSAVHPYLNLPVLYVFKQSDWFKYLNMLIHDENARNHFGKIIQEFCNNNYNFETINKYRYEQFKS